MAANHLERSAMGFATEPSLSDPVNSSSTPDRSRLTYFITRNNGLPVPLIPADELPPSVKLQDVPRVLSPDQAYSLHYIGTAPYTGLTFQLEEEINTTSVQCSSSQPPNETARAQVYGGNGSKQSQVQQNWARQPIAQSTAPASAVNKGAGVPWRPGSVNEAVASWRRTGPPQASKPPAAGDTAQSVINAILKSSSGAETAERVGYRSRTATPPPSGIIPDQNKKEFCTHWILHGWCMFEQQGCRYKHEMLDKEGLAKIGIKHHPKWWQERSAPFKLGTEKPVTMKPQSKPLRWLKVRKESDSESDGSSSFSSSSSRSGSECHGKGNAGEPIAKGKVESTKHRSWTMVVPPTRPSSPPQEWNVPETSRSGDLIDFAPSLPVPPGLISSTTGDSTNSWKSVGIVKSTNVDLPGKPGVIAAATATATATATTVPNLQGSQVFVPAGEPAEKHIVEAQKRGRDCRPDPSCTPLPNQTPTRVRNERSIEKQKEEQLGDKLAGLAVDQMGLFLSNSGEADGEKQKVNPTGAICRPRRPRHSTSSPSAAQRQMTGKR